MFNPSRDQARRVFLDAWRKHREGRPLEAMETRVVAIHLEHPEYHALMEDPDRALQAEWTPEQGETNPFLHLSLHLAIEEQLAIDQPRGIAGAFQGLLARCADRHQALHHTLECLGEAIWRAQRDHSPLDGQAYVECVLRKAG